MPTTQTTLQHSPLPWEAHNSHIRTSDETVATAWDIEADNAHENAAFIVRACNSYDALVACAVALRKIAGYDPCETDYRIHCQMRAIANKALELLATPCPAPPRG